jgi:translocation and assembly module TamA
MRAGRRGADGCGRAAAAVLATVLLGAGCATPPATAPAPAAATAPATPPATPAAAAGRGWVLEVSAPPPLKELLERHLDLARLTTLAGGGELGAGELARLVEAAPAQARELLQTEGHFDAQATVRVEMPAEAGGTAAPLRVRVAVEPGPLTRVRRADIEVEGALARQVAAGDAHAVALLAALRSAWPLPPGSVLRNAAWADAKAAVLAQLRAAGYASASFSGTVAQVDAKRHAARLFLVADTGPLFRSGDIEVDGLLLHGAESVRNLARFSAGTVVTDALLLDFQERLVKSGLFELASVTLDGDPANAGAARILVKVREYARHQLTVAAGVSSNNGPRVTLEHFDRRAFGRAATLRNKAEWAQLSQSWDGELSTHVRPDGYRWYSGLTIRRQESDADIVTGHTLSAGRALEHARIERSQYLQWGRAVRRTGLARTVDEAFTVNQGWVWRDIDNPLLPTDGQTASLVLGAGQARGTGRTPGPLLRGLGRVTLYRPMPGGWFGQARVEAGEVVAKDSPASIDALGFRAGGDDSVRGYPYRSLGPLRDGAVASGKVLFTASAEAARPLSARMPTLWGAVFVDAGRAADDWRSLDPALGYGVGLRWRSPVGPLRLDLAYGHELRRVRMHFSVGIVL